MIDKIEVKVSNGFLVLGFVSGHCTAVYVQEIDGYMAVAEDNGCPVEVHKEVAKLDFTRLIKAVKYQVHKGNVNFTFNPRYFVK